MCQHNDNYFNILECKNLRLDILEDVTGDLEKFPSIESDCTEKCKKKMIEIIQLTMKQYTEMAVSYFNDAKLGVKNEDKCGFLSYIFYCEYKGEGDGLVEMVERGMNVKIIDGEVVHLKPDKNDSKESPKDIESN